MVAETVMMRTMKNGENGGNSEGSGRKWERMVRE
jgi:hypothetical protein